MMDGKVKAEKKNGWKVWLIDKIDKEMRGVKWDGMEESDNGGQNGWENKME